MRRRNQILLPARQRILLLFASLAPSAATLLLRLAVLHLERLDLDEVNVARGFAVCIARLGVVRDEIAWF